MFLFPLPRFSEGVSEMHFNDIREASKDQEYNHDIKKHDWEHDNMPTLHSGFTTGTSDEPKWNVLFMSLYYNEGSYMVRLQDRQTHERAFVEIDTLEGLFPTLELLLCSGRLKFRPERSFSKEGRS